MPRLSKDSDKVIKFNAQVSKVTTLADGGIRIVLDLPESDIETARQMMLVRQQGAFLEIAAVPVFTKPQQEASPVQGWNA